MKSIMFAALSILVLNVQAASACVIAVESNAEVALLREIYNLKNLNLTTQTQNADIGIKFVPQVIKKADPVFGEAKMIEIVNTKADIYERGQVIGSTGFYNYTNFSQRENSPFARDIIRTLEKVGCK